MSEDLPEQATNEGEVFEPRDAIWHAHNMDIPIKVIGKVKARSGNIFYQIEGSGTAVPSDQVEFLENQGATPDNVGENDQSALSADKQLASQKIGELLNERQAKAVRAKEAGKKGNHDTKIAMYEDLREAMLKGDFDTSLGMKGSEPLTVRKFVEELFNQQKKQADELIALLDIANPGKQKKDLQSQLDKSYELYDLVEAAQLALEKVEVSSHAPALEPEAKKLGPVPEVDKDRQNRKQGKERDKKKPNYKFDVGDIVRVRTKDGKKEYEWRVKNNIGYKNKFVKLEDPNGKRKDIVMPEDVLAEWNPKANEPDGLEINNEDDVEQDDSPPPPPVNGGHDNGNYQDNGNGSHDDNANGDEVIDENSSWLNPKRIEELKAQFTEAVGVNRNIDDVAKQNLKTILIHKEINRTIKYAEQVYQRHGIGKIPEYPNQATINRMAEMMDWQDARLQRNIQLGKFRKNDEVKIIKSDGTIEDGWIVQGYSRHTADPGIDVIVKKGNEKRHFSPNKLEEFQERANPDQDKLILQELKQYFDEPAKIKTDQGIVKGQFQGYRPHDQRVYYGYIDVDGASKRLGGVPASEFLSWQNEKLTADVEAEEQAKADQEEADKLAELESKLSAFSNGQRIKIKSTENEWIPGFTFVEYSPDKKAVIVANSAGEPLPLVPEVFIKWQEETGGEDTLNDNEPGETAVIETEPEEGDPTASQEDPIAEKKKKEKENEPTSWWRWQKEKWDNLPSNKAKVALGAGALAFYATIGSPGLVMLPAQHWLHYRHLGKQKEKEEKLKREKTEREAAN
jgi:hypothetical protein